MKYIIKFAKDDRVKYVSHLDIVRVFGRALRRANIHPSYSNGFNPHLLMSFAHPLGVGIASSSELMEIALEDDLTPKELALRLNEAFPRGFKVYAVKRTDAKSPFKNLASAEYKINLAGYFPLPIDSLMQNDALVMPKRTKSGTKDTDILPLIHTLHVESQTQNEAELTAILSCGNDNLKPDLLIEAIERYAGASVSDYTILRTALFSDSHEELVQF